jgi:hypothetical protein
MRAAGICKHLSNAAQMYAAQGTRVDLNMLAAGHLQVVSIVLHTSAAQGGNEAYVFFLKSEHAIPLARGSHNRWQ